MIYGRRFQPQSNLGKDLPLTARARYKHVQWKYTLLFLAGSLAAFLLFAGPSWFYLSQNYGIFEKLAYDTNPILINDLERELIWLAIFGFVSMISIGVFCFYFAMRLTHQMVNPLIRIESHMRKISQGDWKAKDFPYTSTDEFFELQDSYAHFYRNLRAQAETELEVLEKLTIDPDHRSSFANWKAMIRAKQKQLGIETQQESLGISKDEAASVDPAASSSSSPYQRRAS